MLGQRPNADETDRALTALSNASRRRLLFELYEEVNTESGDSINYSGSAPIEGETRQIRLYHTHLPQLEESGYVEWNKAAKTIEPGPRWNEIEPLLELVDAHLCELPPFLQGKPAGGRKPEP